MKSLQRSSWRITQRITFCALMATASSALAQTAPGAEQPPTRTPEGTAADSMPPTPAQTERTTGAGTESMTKPPSVELPPKSTAADRTAPEDRQHAGGTLHPELVGAKVVSPGKTPIGEVVDVVFDSRGQPDYIVIASKGDNAALPYKTASSMIERGTMIVDEAKLRSAPKLEQGAWRTQGDGSWKDAASEYWDAK